MPVNGSLLERCSELLSAHLGVAVDVERCEPVGGGSINDAYRLFTDAGSFFLKTNSADRFPSMFEAEADGLWRLRSSGTLRVPEAIAHGEDHDDSFLLLEWVETGTPDDGCWRLLGKGLARLHRTTWDRFGLDRDNYIGSLRQVNTPEQDWTSFLILHRLEPQLRMARDRRRIEAGMSFRFERLFMKLEGIFPSEPPALLHGDLWNGNQLCDASGAPVLIDPAVYFGHREMDLAMSRLFGGFGSGFLSAYQEEYPTAPGWEERTGLCQLYPLLVHVNLFGGGYVQQVETILGRFV